MRSSSSVWSLGPNVSMPIASVRASGSQRQYEEGGTWSQKHFISRSRNVCHRTEFSASSSADDPVDQWCDRPCAEVVASHRRSRAVDRTRQRLQTCVTVFERTTDKTTADATRVPASVNDIANPRPVSTQCRAGGTVEKASLHAKAHTDSELPSQEFHWDYMSDLLRFGRARLYVLCPFARSP